MPKSRRAVLKAAALAGTAFFIPSGLAKALDGTSIPRGADGRRIGSSPLHVTRSLLHGHVGSDFMARTSGGNAVMLRLVEVEDVPNAGAANLEGSEETFAARFEDSSGILLRQGTYRLDHPYLGRVWWFLVPVGMPSAPSQTYEAIFNNAPTSARRPPRRLYGRR
jgi:hypothetical protein